MKKVCPGCGRDLPLSQYNKRRGHSTGVFHYCRECTHNYYVKNKKVYSLRARDYYQRTKGRYSMRSRRRLYGLTPSQCYELFESSDGLCALCYEEPATDIDHDHETGKVRGALCHVCNKGLGFIERMGATDARAIVEYLTTEWKAA